MLWRGQRESENVEDERGSGRAGGRIAVGGGIGGLILVVAYLLLGGDPQALLEMAQQSPPAQTSQVDSNAPRDEMSQFVSAYINGDEATAKEIDARLQPIHQILFVESSPQPTKWALHLMGKIDTGIRLPLLPMSQSHRPELERRLRAVGAIA